MADLYIRHPHGEYEQVFTAAEIAEARGISLNDFHARKSRGFVPEPVLEKPLDLWTKSQRDTYIAQGQEVAARTVYTDEDRRQAVARWEAAGEAWTFEAVSGELGIPVQTLRTWVRSGKYGSTPGQVSRRRTYSKQQRQAAMEAWQSRQEGQTITDIAAAQGIHPESLRRWIQSGQSDITNPTR